MVTGPQVPPMTPDFPTPDEVPQPEPEVPAAEAPSALAAAPEGELAAEAAPPIDDNKKWYVVKVASGREESIKDAIERRVKIEGLQDCFGRIVIPVERRTEMNKGKRVVKETKLMPGYLLVHVEFNERMLYLFRETSGVGDFVGGGLNKPPPPMPEHEVHRWISEERPVSTEVAPKSRFTVGEHVKVKDGTFAGMDGSVKEILEHKGAVVVELTIFGRQVPVELEYWQVDYA